MPDKIVVDTDVLIDTGRGVQEAISCLSSIERRGPATISAVTQMELIILNMVSDGSPAFLITPE